MEAATGQAPAGAEAQPEAPEGQPEGGQSPEAGVGIEAWQQNVDTTLRQSADAIRQMGELIQTRLPEPEAEPQPDFEQQFNDLFEQSGGYMDPSQLQGLVQQQARSIAEEMVGPLQQQMQQFQQQMTAQELSSLQTEFPELRDEKNADRLSDSVVTAAIELMESGVPQEIAEALVQNKNFVRKVHLAGKAENRASGETPLGGTQPVPQIETGGGAAPGSTSEGDEWDNFVQSRRPMGSVFD